MRPATRAEMQRTSDGLAGSIRAPSSRSRSSVRPSGMANSNGQYTNTTSALKSRPCTASSNLLPAGSISSMSKEERAVLHEAERIRWLSELTRIKPTRATTVSPSSCLDAVVCDATPSQQMASSATSPHGTPPRARWMAISSSAPQLRPATADASTGVQMEWTVKSRSRRQSDPWTLPDRMPPRVQAAANAFDRRNDEYMDAAVRTLDFAKRDHNLYHVEFRRMHRQVFTNRFVDAKDVDAVPRHLDRDLDRRRFPGHRGAPQPTKAREARGLPKAL